MGDNPNPQAGAEEAIVAVLRAEREAQEAVARCTAEAAALVAAARERAARVSASAERRIGLARGKLAAAAQQRIAALADPVAQPGGNPGSGPAEDDGLRRAVDAVVAELTGAAQ